MSKRSILVLGSSNTDMIIKVQRIPRAGETILGGEFASAAGGKGANQAVGAARAGGAVTLIARVGQDMFGEKAVAGFISEGIKVDHIVSDRSSPSGVALIFVGQKGQNSIAVASGANSKLAPADVKRAIVAFRDASVLLLQLETPLKTVIAAAEIAAGVRVKVILNPAPAQALPARLLRHVDVLTPNESEAELLTGVAVKNASTAAKASEKLLARGVRNVIITLGRQGAFVLGKTVREFIPAYKVEAVDTTAAGDVFNGSLAVALAEGRPLLEAARFANAAAALSVTRMGAQTSAPDRGEIEALLATGKIRRATPRPSLFRRNGDSPHFGLARRNRNGA
jgi:ribokinase